MLLLLPLSFLACGDDGGGPAPTPSASGNQDQTWDVAANGIPRFIDTDYIDLTRIHRISRFRSGIGHDYPDDFEKCRTMKHYYLPAGGDPGRTHARPWAEIVIRSPLRGTVTRSFVEWAGTQVWIRSASYPAIQVAITHVALDRPLDVGDDVAEGQQLGHHIGDQTMSDITVGIATPSGWQLVSYFDAMTDRLFERYQARGVVSRGQLAISKEARNADPLACNGQTYVDAGHLENWVTLN